MRMIPGVLVGVLWMAVAAFPQAQMSSGDIKGTITDATSAVIPNASVTATNIDTGVIRATITDETGYFRFLVLPPANYELKVEAGGFAVYARRPVRVTIGQTVIVDAQLQPASLQQEIVVQEEVE